MGEVAYFIVDMLLQDIEPHCKLQRRIILAEVQIRLLAAIFPALHVIWSYPGITQSYHVTAWWLMQS